MGAPLKLNFKSGPLHLFTLSSEYAKPMQDGIFIVSAKQDLVAAFVCDGMGGHAGAEVAIVEIFNAIKETFNDKTPHLPLRELMLSAIELADQKVKALKIGAGSTVVAFGLDQNVLRLYHAGDSIGRVIGARGKVYYSTIEHSPIGHAIESGVLSKKQALNRIDENVVSNGLGFDSLSIEVGLGLSPSVGDLVLLSSDNLPKNFTEEEIIQMASSSEFEKRAETIIQNLSSKKDYRSDDTSFVLFKYSN